MDATVAVAAISAVPATIAACAAVLSARRGKQTRSLAEENRTDMGVIKHQTNGQMDEKIRAAVYHVFNEHKEDVTEAVMIESMRNLLDAMINGTVDDVSVLDTEREHQRRSRRAP